MGWGWIGFVCKLSKFSFFYKMISWRGGTIRLVLSIFHCGSYACSVNQNIKKIKTKKKPAFVSGSYVNWAIDYDLDLLGRQKKQTIKEVSDLGQSWVNYFSIL